MEFVNDIITQIMALKGPALLLVALIVIGYVCKTVGFIPNRLIPAIVLIGGAVLHFFMGGTEAADPGLTHPEVGLALQGLVIGAVAWLTHDKLLSRIIDKYLPFLKSDEEKKQ